MTCAPGPDACAAWHAEQDPHRYGPASRNTRHGVIIPRFLIPRARLPIDSRRFFMRSRAVFQSLLRLACAKRIRRVAKLYCRARAEIAGRRSPRKIDSATPCLPTAGRLRAFTKWIARRTSFSLSLRRIGLRSGELCAGENRSLFFARPLRASHAVVRQGKSNGAERGDVA